MSVRAQDRGTRGRRAAEPETRSARRLQPPSWRDLRLIVGLLLVLLSIAGGVRLVSALDDSMPVYAAARDLLPGQPVTEDDLVAVPVRMGPAMAHYVDAGGTLAPGTYLTRSVSVGELVPASSLGSARQALDKAVNVPVEPVAARTLSAGSVVDVWVSKRDRSVPGEAFEDPQLLLAGAVVDHVPGDTSGLGAGLGRSAVQVVVPAERVGQVVGAVDQGARVTLVPAPRTKGDGG
ncbi:SAF domain-containing protein [Ornithinimicrobium sp. Y1847]|uniref:SAF domain-containing protein n=1 Tax=unclassified Ornithinimicrobium TaxID=2615080 RepID=UPI003B66F57B